jgi:cell division protein FtsW
VTAVIVLVAGIVGGLVVAVIRALFVDEVKWILEQRATRRLDATIGGLPAEMRDRWADGWRAQFSSLVSLPLTALRFELAVRRMPGTLKSAEASLERTIAALSPELREAWADEWRAELASIAEDPLTAARWARGIRRSARALTSPGLERALPRGRIRVPRWAREAGATAAATAATSRTARAGASYSLLLTVTLCLLLAGSVLVYSAYFYSSSDGGAGAVIMLERYLLYGAVGFALMMLVARGGLAIVPVLTGPFVTASFAALVLIKIPGFGVDVNGARRWLGAGPLVFQPSEPMTLALVFYAAKLLAERPKLVRRWRNLGPLALVAGSAVLLISSEPDLGTALVICFTMSAMLVAAGMPVRWLATATGAGVLLVLMYVMSASYRRDRLMTFLDPWAHAGDQGFQAVQGQIAIGSGGLFGHGLGQSSHGVVLPGAPTNSILALIGQQLGLVGILGILFLFGLVAYGGLRVARDATGIYASLLAAGITSLFLSQALLHVFSVLGLAPMVGVPLPFISYGSANLIVLLVGMGVLLNIARGGHVRLRPVQNVARIGDPAPEPT